MHLDIAIWPRDPHNYGNINRRSGTYVRTRCRIMLGIRKSRHHVTNKRLYIRVKQRPNREMIRERQLKFTDHCILMTYDEPALSYTNQKKDHLFDHER